MNPGPRNPKAHFVVTMSLTFVYAVAVVLASESNAQELTELPLQDLMQIEVTSASRKPQPLGETASAVYILTADEIERSGATTIPELLRRVPGLHVARLDASSWAVTARGFNHRYASKMLVQIDGRTVYTPLFAGVYWDAQDLLLSDIDRIEVIRGPGATMWGENAVNGVINIITKQAASTLGTRVETVAGSEEASVAVRHGGTTERLAYRWYARGSHLDPVALRDGSSAEDGFRGISTGFRLDLDAPRPGWLSLDGQMYANRAHEEVDNASLTPPYTVAFDGERRVSGGYVGGRLRPFARVDATVFGFAERTRRESPDGFLEIRHTYELDYQQRDQFGGGRHDLVWGGQARYTHDGFENSFRVSLDPNSRTLHLLSGFVQDEIALAGDRLRLTPGAKLTHNSFTGLEVQPSLRALVKLDREQALWGAVSRAVRTPARIERDMRVNAAVLPRPLGPPVLVSLFGSAIDPEELLAFEAGYRAQSARAGLDLAVFSNRYQGLVTTELGVPGMEMEPSPHLLVPILLENGGPARTSGLEVLGRTRIHPSLELSAWYSWFRLVEGFMEDAPEEGVLIPEGGVAAVPAQQARVDARIELPRSVSLDTSLHYVGSIEAQDVSSYVRLDLRFAWRPRRSLELSCVGQNLLQNRHPEFVGDQGKEPFLIERALLARLVWTF